MSDMSISPILLSAKEAKRPYALARSSLDTAMQVRALGWGFRKTAAQLYCPNTLESCMLGYLEVKSTKRFEGVSGFLCLGRLFQGQPNEAALCI